MGGKGKGSVAVPASPPGANTETRDGKGGWAMEGQHGGKGENYEGRDRYKEQETRCAL